MSLTLIALSNLVVFAQVDSIPPAKDSLSIGSFIAIKDTTNTSSIKDTSITSPEGSIKTTILYSSEDSLSLFIPDKKAYLYKNSKVEYGKTSLEAEDIVINWGENTLDAAGRTDSTGKWTGKPLFKEGEESFQADSMTYNIQTKKGVIHNVVTQQGDGFIQGEIVKKTPENEFFIKRAIYTTCNLEHPHFGIRSTKTKLTKNNNLVTGPFYLEVAGAPTPLGFLFGIFPQPKQKASGIVFPQYGESRENGFFLQRGGYHFALSEYFNLTVLGDYYTKGNYRLNLSSEYKKRYRFGGNFSLDYSSNKIEVSDSSRRENAYAVTWSHNPVPRGTGSFSANVNIRGNGFNQRNNGTLEERTSNNFNSTIRYTKTLSSLFSGALSLRHDQTVIQENASDLDQRNKDLVTVTLPFNLTMKNVFPFQKPGQTQKGLLSKISLSYKLDGQALITNKNQSSSLGFATNSEAQRDTLSFNFDNLPTLLSRADIGMRHSIPVATYFNVFKYFNVNVGFNFNQSFYKEKYSYTWDDVRQLVIVDTTQQLGSSYDLSTNASLNTRIYGTFYFKKGKIQAIRHIIRPSLSYSYSPDFSDNFYQEIVTDTQTLRAPKFRGIFSGTPGSRDQSVLSFTVNNTFEAKLKPENDSTQAKKIKILDNLTFNGSYDFNLDSFNLSRISIRAATNIANNLFNLNFNSTLDPYQYLIDGDNYRRVDEFAWNKNQGLGTLTNAGIGAGLKLSSQTLKGVPNNNPDEFNTIDNNTFANPLSNPVDQALYNNNPDQYIDFDIPWSLNLNYTLNYTRFPKKKITQSLSFSGDINLTQKWKMAFNSGYDFESKQLTNTNISMVRDLHCWEMFFNWIPFGRYQSYTFTIRVKASTLKDLKVERKRNWYDG